MEQRKGQVVLLGACLAAWLHLDPAVQGQLAVQVMRLLLALTGIATYYTGPIGAPLYCDNGSGYTYDTAAPPWVSLSEDLYKSGWAECGDKIKVVFEDGTSLIALAMDAGPLQDYYLEESPELPLLVDVPEHLWPRETMSAQVKVLNLTEIYKLFKGFDNLARAW